MLHFLLQPSWCFRASERGNEEEAEGGRKSEMEKERCWNRKRKLRKTKRRKVWEEVGGQSLVWCLSCPPTGPCCCANPNSGVGEVWLSRYPLPPPSLPRAHPTDRMNNKPKASQRQRKSSVWHGTTAISVKCTSCSKSYLVTFFHSCCH